MENKFKKGLLLGGLLSIASIVGYVIKKHHHSDLTEEVQAELKDLTKQVKKKIASLEDITKNQFTDVVNKVVDEYAKKKALAEEIKIVLMAVLLEKWEEMEEAYKEEHSE